MYLNELSSDAITWTLQPRVQDVLCARVCMGQRWEVGAGLNYVGKCLKAVCAALASGLEAGAPCGGGHFTASSEAWPLLDSSLRERCLLTLSPDPEAGPARLGCMELRLCED